MKKKALSVIQWVAAIMVAFCFANLLCLIYERPAGWIDTPNGASPACWRPGAFLIHGTEGYGTARIDDNGYINPSGVLMDSYILMMGSSHTQGKEVPASQKYSVLVNDHFTKGSDTLYTYNIASDGNYLPTLIKHFKAAVQAFPNAEIITIEIGNTDFSVAQLEGALEQIEYHEEENAVNQYQTAGYIGRIKFFVKETFPLISLIKTKLASSKASGVPGGENTVNSVRYAELLEQAMVLIRSECDCPIVFVYHPTMEVDENGDAKIRYGTMWPAFAQACHKNGIDVIDMGPAFEQWYYEYRQLPCGFSNTTPGTGHLNSVGHQLLANAIIDYIEEAEK